ncbi:MAG: iron ABC transporter permease [Alphaproteobacteria bacterium]|nr:iron ABC transporter permease [Alphaproteobacteria bacterium]
MTAGGRSARASTRGWDRESVTQAAIAVFVIALVLHPVFWIFEASIRTSIFERSYTLGWYHEAYIARADATALLLGNTLVFAVGGTLLALAIGIAAALLVARSDLPGRSAFSVLFMGSFFLSPMIIAVSWSLLASPRIGFYNALLRMLFDIEALTGPLNIFSLGGMVWTAGLYFSPYVFLLVSAALRSVDPSLEEAARMSGAGTARVLMTVTLPLVRPAILAAAILALVLAFGQFGIPAILGIPARLYVLTTSIFASMSAYPTEREFAAVLSVLLLGVAFVAIGAQRRLLGGRRFTTVTARGFRQPFAPLGPWRWPIAILAWGFMLLTAVMPVVALAYASFTSRWTTRLDSSLLTLRNYVNLAEREPAAWAAIQNSVLLSLLGATLAIAVAVFVSVIVMKRKDWLGRTLEYVAMLPISMPGMVFAVGLLAAYIRPPLVLYGTPYIILIAYVTLFIPVGMRSASAALSQLDPALEEAAQISGAGWLRRLAGILVPLIKASLVAGWVLIFVTLMKEFSASVLLGSPTVPVNATVLWNLWNLGQYGTLTAFEVINTLMMGGTAALALWYGRRTERSGRPA